MADFRLEINDFRFPAFIGWTDAEMALPQTLRLDLRVNFSAKPQACLSEKLSDTFDYEPLVNSIRNIGREKSFRLLEEASEFFNSVIAAEVKNHSGLTYEFSLTKVNPPVPGLEGGVTFVRTGPE